MHIPDHYAALQVSRDADASVIRAAYKVLIQRYHPDKHPGSAESVVRTRQINEAYFILSDETLRAAHDSLLAEQEAASKPVQPPPPEPPQQEPSAEPSTARAGWSWWPQLAWIVVLVVIRATSGSGVSTAGLVDDVSRVFSYTAIPAFVVWVIVVLTGTKGAGRLIMNCALFGATIAVISGVVVRNGFSLPQARIESATPAQPAYTAPASPPAQSPQRDSTQSLLDEEASRLVVEYPELGQEGPLTVAIIAERDRLIGQGYEWHIALRLATETVMKPIKEFESESVRFLYRPENSDLLEPEKNARFQEAINMVDSETGGKLGAQDLLNAARARVPARAAQ